MHIFVTGSAGFIGSNLVDRLLTDGHSVVGYDNLSTGKTEFLKSAVGNTRFCFIEADLLDLETLAQAMTGAEVVFHLAANADVRFGLEHPRKDLDQNTIATLNVLEAMRSNKVGTIVFSSTGSVYGEAKIIPTPEDAPFPIQTSLYGASKVAAEGLIAAYCEGFGLRALIMRFVSILGERYTHGHVLDFVSALEKEPSRLHILGNGKQRKSYLYVGDCIDAMLMALDRAEGRLNFFNLGTNEYCEVNDSAGWISARLGLSPIYSYSGGDRGWVGDNPFIFLDTKRIQSLGWRPQINIQRAVEKTVDWLTTNRWVFDSNINR